MIPSRLDKVIRWAIWWIILFSVLYFSAHIAAAIWRN